MRKKILTVFMCSVMVFMVFGVSLASGFEGGIGAIMNGNECALQLREKLYTDENIALGKTVVSGSAVNSSTNAYLTNASTIWEWCTLGGNSAKDCWAYIDLGSGAEFDLLYIGSARINSSNVRGWSLWVSDAPEREGWERVFVCDIALCDAALQDGRDIVVVKWDEIIQKRYIKFQADVLLNENKPIALAKIGAFKSPDADADADEDEGSGAGENSEPEPSANGVEVFANKQIGQILVMVNVCAVDGPVQCVAALYDNNDRMIAVQSSEINNKKETINIIFDGLSDDLLRNGYLKVFLVDDLEHVMPVGDCVRVKLTEF